MKMLKTHSSRVQPEKVDVIKDYIKDICRGDCALAEPSSDSRLNWLEIALIIGLSEANFSTPTGKDQVVLGFYCESCNCIEMHVQSYTLEPELCLMAMTDAHHDHKFTAIYMEV